jgi:nucleoside-diphosphate-sugar epimerase
MPRRVLIVGGTGFIGGCVARALAAHGDTVVTLARGPYEGPTHVLLADRRDANALARVLAGQSFDATLDFAAYDGAGVEALAAVPSFSPGRYLLISTGQVCLVGTGTTMPYREEEGTTPLRPEPPAGTHEHRSWAYGVGKRAAEAAATALAERRGWEVTILRLPIVLGAGDTSLRTWAWLERFLDGGPVLLPDGGERPLRFLWSEDVATAIERLLDLRPPSRVYHLAQPDILPLRDVLARMAALAGRDVRFIAVDRAQLEAAGIGPEILPYAGRWASVLDPTRAEREWGFRGTSLERYLPEVVRAHLEHPPATSDMGYHARPLELALAKTLENSAAR